MAKTKIVNIENVETNEQDTEVVEVTTPVEVAPIVKEFAPEHERFGFSVELLNRCKHEQPYFRVKNLVPIEEFKSKFDGKIKVPARDASITAPQFVAEHVYRVNDEGVKEYKLFRKLYANEAHLLTEQQPITSYGAKSSGCCGG